MQLRTNLTRINNALESKHCDGSTGCSLSWDDEHGSGAFATIRSASRILVGVRPCPSCSKFQEGTDARGRRPRAIAESQTLIADIFYRTRNAQQSTWLRLGAAPCSHAHLVSS